METQRSSASNRLGLWATVAALAVGLVLIAGWLGLFGSAPQPGDHIPPSALSTATPTEPSTVTATPSTPEAAPSEAPSEPQPESSPTSATPVTAAPPPVDSVVSPSGSPIRVEVHSAGGESLVDTRLTGAGLDADGILAPPHGVAGWYNEPGWAKPGWPGASIIAGHVRGGGSPDVFWNIPQARPGDIVTVSYDSGQRTVFRVTRSQAMHKRDVPRDDSIWDHASATPKLALITCDPATPTRSDGHLEGNWVLWAEPVA